VGLFKRKNKEDVHSMLTQSEFNVIYEFLDRVSLNGHNDRITMNSVIVKLQSITEPDHRRKGDGNKN